MRKRGLSPFTIFLTSISLIILLASIGYSIKNSSDNSNSAPNVSSEENLNISEDSQVKSIENSVDKTKNNENKKTEDEIISEKRFFKYVEPSVCGDNKCEFNELCEVDCNLKGETPNEENKIINYKHLPVVKRTMYSDTYYNETSNNYTVKVGASPINYLEGTEYKPIDTKIVSENCDFDYCVRKGIYFADFKTSPKQQQTVKFLYEGKSISYTPLELKYFNGIEYAFISEVNEAQGHVQENSFIYPEVYGKGLTIVYEYNKAFLKEGLIIQDSGSLPKPSISEENLSLNLQFEINTEEEIYDRKKDIKWNKNSEFKSEEIGIKDKQNSKDLFSLLTPYAVDNNGNKIKLDYTLRKKNNKLLISINTPYSWLIDKSRVYPVQIDPSTTLDNLKRHGEVTLTNYGPPNWFFSDDEDFDDFFVGERIDDEGVSNVIRSYVEWRSSAIQDAIDPDYDINYIYLHWSVASKKSNVDDTVNFFEIDEGVPQDLTPNIDSEMENLFSIINDGNKIGEDNSPDIGYNTEPLNDYANDALEDAVDNEEAFIIGFTGLDSYYPSLHEFNSFVKIDGVGSEDEPYLIVGYSVPDPSGQPSQCTIPDGTYNSGCSCLSDSDCPSGYFCDQRVFAPNACRLETICSGTIATIVEDSSSNPLNGTYVYLNGINKGPTNDDGLRELTVSNVGCGSLQSVEVKCNDDTIVCGTDSTSMDQNSDYDSLVFSCDVCLSKKDFFINDDDIILKAAASGTNITATIHTTKVEAVNVAVRFTKICNKGATYVSNTTFITNVTLSNNYLVSSVMDLSDCSTVRVYVDPDNNILESNERNNDAKKFIINPIKVYLNVDTGYSLVDDEIEEFIGDFVQLTSQADSQLDIYVGRKLGPKLIDSGWGLSDNIIKYNGKKEGLPYNGIIGKKFVNGKPRLYVFGNEIEGTFAALRKLASEQENYLNEQVLNEETPALYLGETDFGAISVFDYLHTDENKESYRRNDITFAQVTEKVLRRETFNLAIKRVLTNNDQTALRLKNINSELSPDYRDFINNSRPVVIGHGLFSDLFTMESLGLKIAKDEKYDGQYVRDVWMAEYKGGPNTECDTCPNYSYEDVVNYYWPALFGGVLKYTGQSKLDFIGFSSGATGAISYDKWENGKDRAGYYLNDEGQWESFNLPSNSINHMVLIAPMLAFDEDTLFTNCINKYGDETNLRLQQYGHFTPTNLTNKFISVAFNRGGLICSTFASIGGFFLKDGSKTSYNFWKDITMIVQNKNDLNPSFNSLNEIMLIRGEIGGPKGNDFVVPDADLDYVYENSNTNESYKARVFFPHAETWRAPGIYKHLISKFLNDKEFDNIEKRTYDIEEDV